MGSLAPIGPHPRHHLLDVGDRGFWLYAVAEIEDEATAGEIRQHVVNRAVQRLATGNQHQRIEIALHRHAALHPLSLIHI